MEKEIIRVEPLTSYLKKWGTPTSTVVKHGDLVYVTGTPPFDPETGEVYGGDIKRQTEIVLDQLQVCVEAAGSSLEKVLKCNVYCTSAEHFAAVNEVYVRYFPTDWPARMFVVVLPWPSKFDIEIDCVAAI